jgi:hypothetical protein
LRDFWYDTQKKSKRHARDNGLEGWNEVAVWQKFKPSFISGEIWMAYIEHVTSERFSRRSQSGADNRNRQIHGSVTTHWRIRPIQRTCKADGKINFNEIYR